MCRQPLETGDHLKKHLKADHEVVKYKMDLVVALSTLSTKEEKTLVEEGRKRLLIMQETGVWHNEEDLFSKGTPLVQEIKKEAFGEMSAKEIAEINKYLMDIDNKDEEEESSRNTAKPTAKRSNEEPCPDTPPLSPLPDGDLEDRDIEIIEIINKVPTTRTGHLEKRIKLESGIEKPSSNYGCPSTIKVEVTEPEIEMVIEGVANTEEVEQEVDKGEDHVVDEPLPFCRLCYITFSSHADQLPHEQKVLGFKSTLTKHFFTNRCTPLRRIRRR